MMLDEAVSDELSFASGNFSTILKEKEEQKHNEMAITFHYSDINSETGRTVKVMI